MTDIKSHWKRTRHTFIRSLVIGLPLLYGLLSAIYFRLRTQIFSFPQALTGFSLLLTIAIEFIAGLIIVQLVQLEQNAGNFGNELRLGVTRSRMILSRLFFLILLLIWVFVSSNSIFLILLKLTGITVDFVPDSHVILLLFLTFLPFLPVDLFLAYKSGITGTILANAIFALSGILLGTTDLGLGIWSFLPWVWPVRLTYRSNDDAVKFCLLAICLTVFLTILLILWYNRWEPQSREE